MRRFLSNRSPLVPIGLILAIAACQQLEPAGPSASRVREIGTLAIQADSLLTVHITGKFNVKPNRICVWTAAVTGGNGTYAYTWKKNGVVVGTSRSDTLNTGSSSFALTVRVVSGTQAASDSANVTVSPNGQNC